MTWRRSGPWAVAAGAVLGLALGALLWTGSRRLPVSEARRFFHAPIEVGTAPPTAPARPDDELAAELAEARRAFEEARYDEAAELYARVVSGDPGGPLAGSAQWNLTRARLRSGDGNGALDALDGLLRRHADWLAQESPALREGIEQLAAGHMPAAQEAFDRVIEEQAGHELVPLAWALKARIHWNHGEPLEAIRSFSELFASVRDEVPAYSELGGLLARYADGDAAVAEAFAEQAERADEGWGDIYRYLSARSLLEQSRTDETREALERLREQSPDGDFSHIVDLEHAWNLFRAGQAQEALAIFQRLERESTPERARAFDRFFDIRAELPMGIARCELELGRYPEAITAFERALAEHPRSIYVLENQLGLALAYERAGRLAEAASQLERAIDQHRDEPHIWAVRQQLARVRARLSGSG